MIKIYWSSKAGSSLTGALTAEVVVFEIEVFVSPQHSGS
jgi:hypothetical protein